jgi:hypothetical protein
MRTWFGVAILLSLVSWQFFSPVNGHTTARCGTRTTECGSVDLGDRAGTLFDDENQNQASGDKEDSGRIAFDNPDLDSADGHCQLLCDKTQGEDLSGQTSGSDDHHEDN